MPVPVHVDVALHVITNLFIFGQLTRNWFLPGEPSLKRAHIQRLIYEIFEEQAQKVLSVDTTDKHPSSQFPDTNEKETGVEFLAERCSSPKTWPGYSSGRNTELGIQIKEAGLKSKELFEPGTTARSLSNENKGQRGACQQRSFMSPVEVIIIGIVTITEQMFSITIRTPVVSFWEFQSISSLFCK